MTLVERDHELDVLARRLADCVRGVSSVTLVSGAPGTGKTALLQAMAEDAAVSSSALVLTAYGNRSGQAEPFEAVTQLFGCVELTPGDHERLLRLLAQGRAAAQPADPVGRPVDHLPADIPHRLVALLAKAVGDRPLAVLVDDVHLVDAASRQWLLHLARHPGGPRAMMVLNDCEGPSPVSPLFYTELLRLPSYRRMTLKPISAAGVRRIVESLGEGDEVRLAPELHEITGGNPLLLRALTQDRMASGTVPGTLFRQAVFACLRHAQPQVCRTAEAVALLGESATPSLVAKLLELGDQEVAANLDVLAATGLVQGVRYRHPDIRAAILDACEERSRLHASAARLLHREGLPAPVVAEHLLTSGQAREPWQTQALETAANEARDPERITAYLELAYRDCGDAEHRTKLVQRLVRNVWRASPAAIVGTLPRMEQLPKKNTGAVLTLAMHLFWSGSPDEAAALLDRVISCGYDENAAAAALVVRRWLVTVCPVLPVKYEALEPDAGQTALAHGHQAVSALHGLLHGADRATCSAQAQDVLRGIWLGDGISVWAASIAVTALIHAERLDAAAAACDRLLEESARHRGNQGLLGMLRADIALRQGDLAAAERYARQAGDNLPVLHWGVLSDVLRSVRLAVAVGNGDLAQAAALAGSPVSDALLETCYGLRYLFLRGRYHLASEQPKAALRDFLLVGRLAARWGMDLPSVVEWRVGAAEAHLALGERGHARRLIEEHLALLDSHDHRLRASALRVRSALLALGDRITCLRQAAEAAKEGGDRLELARIMAELHEACRTVGETDLAKVAALQALKLADECQSGPLQRKFAALRRPAPSGQRGAAPAGLTASELRVAALAARGHTNREIAGELHVTMSTVEQHLTKVYRKLNVRHRKELALRIEQAV
ncbi:AAA family ATPase [Streptomyces sp. URMC 125]|uniref:AAA family ATPase n=1 Tax=Streptomyces sp. URMC 125 TaxID=3423419 RepID=UPI003F1C6B4C